MSEAQGNTERHIRNLELAQRVKDTFFDKEDLGTINTDPNATIEVICQRKDNPLSAFGLIYVRDTEMPRSRMWREGTPHVVKGDVINISPWYIEKIETRYGILPNYVVDVNGRAFAIMTRYELSLEGQAYVATDVVDTGDIEENQPRIGFPLDESSDMHNFEEEDYTSVENLLEEYKKGLWIKVDEYGNPLNH